MLRGYYQGGYQYDAFATTEAVFCTGDGGTVRVVSDGSGWGVQ